jgi:hypothetical protein
VAIGDGNSQRSGGRAFLVYNLWRLGLLALCLGVGWVAGIHSVWLIVGALLVSGVLSWFLLRRQREAMGVAVEQTVERSRVRMAERAAVEDSYVDAMETEQSAAPAPDSPPVRPGSTSSNQPAS